MKALTFTLINVLVFGFTMSSNFDGATAANGETLTSSDSDGGIIQKAPVPTPNSPWGMNDNYSVPGITVNSSFWNNGDNAWLDLSGVIGMDNFYVDFSDASTHVQIKEVDSEGSFIGDINADFWFDILDEVPTADPGKFDYNRSIDFEVGGFDFNGQINVQSYFDWVFVEDTQAWEQKLTEAFQYDFWLNLDLTDDLSNVEFTRAYARVHEHTWNEQHQLHVSLDATAEFKNPEPATMALMGFGSMLLIRRRRPGC